MPSDDDAPGCDALDNASTSVPGDAEPPHVAVGPGTVLGSLIDHAAEPAEMEASPTAAVLARLSRAEPLLVAGPARR